jgi:hypothetical protein
MLTRTEMELLPFTGLLFLKPDNPPNADDEIKPSFEELGFGKGARLTVTVATGMTATRTVRMTVGAGFAAIVFVVFG